MKDIAHNCRATVFNNLRVAARNKKPQIHTAIHRYFYIDMQDIQDKYESSITVRLPAYCLHGDKTISEKLRN